jgi:hypothetical protein
MSNSWECVACEHTWQHTPQKGPDGQMPVCWDCLMVLEELDRRYWKG